MSIRKQLNNHFVFSVASFIFTSSALMAQDVQPQAHAGTAIEQPFHNQPIQQFPTQQQWVQPQAHAGTIVQNPSQQVLLQLQNILNQQAQLGRFPSNNALLNSIQNAVNQHGNPFATPTANTTTPPINSTFPTIGTRVMIKNTGPGQLRIKSPNQIGIVLPAGSSHQMVVNQSFDFTAIQSNTNIEIKHIQGPMAKFWDADDNRFTNIQPNLTQKYVLSSNKPGYKLMKFN